ncbi:iron-sulfur cluster biosynthesis family protein [Pediococcus claussenii]|uniref:Core domain-containing protein n=1 Tax=Pediococcus claussenii (strain ATCC BAA-344 / DSM 14800 / JCM 18046 / KCTC 3811 / LMG 21948 / P06) TaxID=701521 RepID=G8PBK1_PEDCP|nr:iron-sulfur cluster biosynthesis family protein [Pediococcus claussenii]AEV94750.1 hypothetical protein PECL_447 [Pediococcus claussenii ATCC BAA-344]ANZ69946.1 hypothetical protein AYR57_06305 [Pediococcus claussenii]ANZ71762.1 hypothetical protein AYR58_06305 [Pediococcus claussenii]KRN20929.1 hypothetical protein IV79_GL000154 [Pediococcus claussenii]
MKLNIKPNAFEYLKSKGIDGQHIFLALDDGSSKFSKLGGSCAVGNKYQIVISPVADDDYSTAIDNDQNVNLTTGKEELTFLGEGLALDYKMGILKLSDNGGILDGAVTVTNYHPDENLSTEEKRKEMKAIGNNIC